MEILEKEKLFKIEQDRLMKEEQERLERENVEKKRSELPFQNSENANNSVTTSSSESKESTIEKRYQFVCPELLGRRFWFCSFWNVEIEQYLSNTSRVNGPFFTHDRRMVRCTLQTYKCNSPITIRHGSSYSSFVYYNDSSSS